MNICIYSECNKHGKRVSEYIQNAKICRMNIRIYSEEREETNIYEYEYIHLKIFEYIRISEYLLHTGSMVEKKKTYMDNENKNKMIS